MRPGKWDCGWDFDVHLLVYSGSAPFSLLVLNRLLRAANMLGA